MTVVRPQMLKIPITIIVYLEIKFFHFPRCNVANPCIYIRTVITTVCEAKSLEVWCFVLVKNSGHSMLMLVNGVELFSVDVEFWDESPKVFPPARQNTCGDCLLGWKERKYVGEKRFW